MKTLLALSLVAIGLLAPGCKSTGIDQAGSVAGKLRELSTELDRAKTDLDAATGAMKFDPKGDLKVQHKNYVDKVNALDAQATKIHGIRANLMKAREEFVKSAQQQNAGISDADLRKKGQEASDKLVARFSDLSEKADATRANYDATMKDMRDVQNYLEHNLNPAGVSAVGDTASKATKNADKVKSGIDGIQAELKKIADDMDVPPPPPPPAPEAPKK